MSKILGIDLGTTNSAMAIIEGGEPNILENEEGNRTTPSVVAISKTGERLVGQVAKRQAVTNPQNTIYGIKRLIGHKPSDDVVKKEKENVAFDIVDAGDSVKVKMNNKDYSPEEISSMIIGKLKKDAEAKTGDTITEAVITVPAYFDDSQRQATKDAGKIAGLNVKRIINEPTAAALAYGFDKKKDEQIVVYDFGGGTFDISVLEVSGDGDEQSIEVKATGGDSHMGGRDIDQKIIQWMVAEFKKESGVDISKDPLALQRLDEAAEKAKHELSNTSESEINIPFITSTDAGPQHLLLKLSRAKLEELASEFVDRSVEITKQVVADSPFEISDIDEVILVGGQTRMPAIGNAVKALFGGKEPNRSINPDEVVALGAAIQAGIFQGDVKDVLLLDVTPLSLGIETMGNVATKLIDKNTTIPASKSQIFSTAADNQTSVEVHVTQGERPMAADNKSLGRFILDGIPPSPRGVPQVEVTFDIDANGILTVKALDKSSGKEQSIRIEGSSALSDEEIEKMKKDAEANADEDKIKKEAVDVKNLAEQSVIVAEKSIKEYGDKIPEDVKKTVEEKIEVLKKAKEGDDLEAIKKANQELSESMSKIGEHLTPDEAKEGAEGSEAKKDEPIDVEAEGADEKPEDDKKEAK